MRGRGVDPKGRSKTIPFIKLHRGVTGSIAWRSLPTNARCVILEIWERHDGTNNGRIPMSVRELKTALGIGSDKVRDAINQAIDRGFLIRRQQGSFSVKNRSATEWEITAEACEGAPPKCLYRDYDKNLRNLRQVQTEPEAGTVRTKDLPNITRTEPEAGIVKACFDLPTEPEAGSLIESTRQMEVSYGRETRSKPDADRIRARLKAGKASAPKGFMSALVRETGISAPSLANFASGRFPISADRLARLSAALDAREAA